MIATFVTARLSSSRLPGKQLIELKGRPAMTRLIERVSQAKLPERVVLCTTEERTDDELEQLAGELGVECFRGSSEDILARWLGATKEFDVEFFAASDGDNVFVDPGYVDRVVKRHRETGADYITCEGLPLGVAPYGVSAAGLARVCKLKRETNTEGQSRFFQDPDVVAQSVVEAAPEHRFDARLTIDYPEDVEMLEALLEALESDGVEDPSLEQIVAKLSERPDIVAINSDLQDEYWERYRRLYPPVKLGE